MRVIISGPSCCGKTTIISHYIEKYGEFKVSKSYTTRSPRSIDDNEYIFIDTNEFTRLISENFFLEYEYIFGNYYGISNNTLTDGHLFFIIDVNGMEKIKSLFPNILTIIIIPPNYNILKERLKERINMDDRLNRVEKEINMHNKFDFMIVNNEIHESVDMLHNIIKIKKHQNDAKEVIKSINHNITNNT